MKKRLFTVILVLTMSMLTACGMSKENQEIAENKREELREARKNAEEQYSQLTVDTFSDTLFNFEKKEDEYEALDFKKVKNKDTEGVLTGMDSLIYDYNYLSGEMEKELKDWADEEEVKEYLRKLLHKEAFDKAGLIYGVGHAIYSKSDPRAVLLKEYTIKLAKEKGMDKELALYEMVERLAPEVIRAERKMYKGVSINVDFYSGFVYKMLELPEELFTPMFAIARIVGWSAHRMEELANNSKIIRPAYKAVSDEYPYVPMEER